MDSVWKKIEKHVKDYKNKEKVIQKETLAKVFRCEYSEIFRNTFFTEYLRTTASVSTHFCGYRFNIKKIARLCPSDNSNWTVMSISIFTYASENLFLVYDISDAAHQRCSKEKLFWKYAANLQENTHAGVWFQ